MAISDILAQLAYYQGGGGRESSLDKLNKTIATIGNIPKQMQEIKNLSLQRKLNELKLKEAGIDINAKERANTPTGVLLGATDAPTFTKQLTNETAPLPSTIVRNEQPIDSPEEGGTPFGQKIPMPTVLQNIPEQATSARDAYNKYSDAKAQEFGVPKQLMGLTSKEAESVKDYFKAPTAKAPLSNESAIISRNYGVDTIRELFPEYRDDMKKLIGVTNAEVAIKKQQKMQQGANSGRDFSNESSLRREFIERPEVKDFQSMNTNVKSMDSILEKALSGDQKNKVALDQALNTMYNKLTDPQSVVRESEYARTAENLPLVNRIQGAISKLRAGGAGYTNEDRKALVLGAKIIANERGKTFNSTRNEYETLSNEYQIPSGRIVGTVKPFTPYSINGNANSGELMVDPVTGVRAMVYPDGRIEEVK